MGYTVVIPARYASTRLPGKPLRDIAGKTMIQRVYERACESRAEHIIIATDDQRIADAAHGFGAPVCMTDSVHRSGSERLAEVVDRLGLADDHIVVNVQGDEPLIPPAIIDQVAQNAEAHPLASIATLCTPIGTVDELFDPNIVKVVTDNDGYALYFSRAPIPWDRDAFALTRAALPPHGCYFRHVGLYAYRAGFLTRYVQWPVSALEQIESLEQLRALAHGSKIHVAQAVTEPPAGVDTEQDLARVTGWVLATHVG